MIERDTQRQRAAERMPDEQRPLQPQRGDEAREDLGLAGEVGLCRAGRHRIAGAGPIDCDDAEIGLEPFGQRVGEVAKLPAQSVDEQQGWGRYPDRYSAGVRPRPR